MVGAGRRGNHSRHDQPRFYRAVSPYWSIALD